MSVFRNKQGPKRMLIVVPIYGSYRAFLKGAAAWFSARGWEVHVATNLTGAKVLPDNAQLHDISIPRGGNSIQLCRSAWALRQLIRLLQPVIVHAHFSVGMLVTALARPRGVCAVGTFQGLRFPLARGVARAVFKIAECFSVWRLQRSWVLTEDDYRAVPKFIRNKLRIQSGFGFGCDVNHYSVLNFRKNDRIEQRRLAGIGSEDFVFVFVGRLTAFKGYPLVLEAFNRLCSERNDVSLLVVGEEDPLHAVGFPCSSQNDNIYHVGWKDDPAPMLLMADAMVFPSSREGMPVCVMEALAMDLPVILSNSRGCRQLARLAESNLVLDELSCEAVYWKMLKLLDARKPLAKYPPELRLKIDRDRFHQHLHESYEDLLG
ncbi:glycosyltransferase [Opitutales bacterium]|nr:glycosyltransferase [Opitutales bacterium]